MRALVKGFIKRLQSKCPMSSLRNEMSLELYTPIAPRMVLFLLERAGSVAVAKVMNVVNGTKRDNSVVIENQYPEMMLFFLCPPGPVPIVLPMAKIFAPIQVLQ